MVRHDIGGNQHPRNKCLLRVNLSRFGSSITTTAPTPKTDISESAFQPCRMNAREVLKVRFSYSHS